MLETLELLNDVDQRLGEYIVKVEEDVHHEPGALHRRVRLHVTVPQVDAPDGAEVDSDLPFLYIMRTPRRNTVWSVHDVRVAGADARLLSHDEHLLYAQGLIATRFWTAVSAWLNTNDADIPLAVALVDQLIRIPAVSPLEADAIIGTAFDADGLLRALGMAARIAPLERRLFRLCKTLADRYLLGIGIDCEPGAQITIDYQFEDLLPEVDGNFATSPSWLSKGRRWIGAAPWPIHFHAPLARVTGSYDVRVHTHPSAYVHTQVFLEANSNNGYQTLNEETQGVESWTSLPGMASAHLCLANGNRAPTSISVGVKAFERLPGSAGRALAVAVGTLVSLVCLWYARLLSGGSLDGDAAALGVGGFALIVFGADILAFSASRGWSVSVGSRVNQALSAFILFIFLILLLMPDQEYGVQSNIGRWLIEWGRVLVIAVAGLNSWWAFHRYNRAYQEVVRVQKARGWGVGSPNARTR